MTHRSQRSRISAQMRSREAADRRQYHRFDAHGLVVRIGDKLLEVHDVSVGGLRVERLDAPIGQELALVLLPRDGRQLDLSSAMSVRGEVVGHMGAWTRLRFAAMSYTLAKFLVQILARRHGVEPYIFK